MSYCLNPSCKKPYNPDNAKFCLSCRSELLLKNHYRAVRPIGEGGMGRTFLAVDEDRLNAPCVIKQLLPAPEIQGNSQAMAKATILFEQEARQLLQLGEQHSQIPALLAYFEQDKRLYLVQQLIDGQDLWHELQQQGAFSEQQVRQVLLDLLPVLQFVHEHQVVHRDIKPTNIIRRTSATPNSPPSYGIPSFSQGGSRRGSPISGGVGESQLVLIDFGVSKQLSHRGLTHTGTRTGTEGYAPIEQIRGGKAYPASDLYSLGVTCIQLLTGAALDELYDPIESRWSWRSLLWRLGNHPVSDHLALILDKMLKDSIKERYPSAIEVLQDLNGSAPRKYASPISPFVPSAPPLPVIQVTTNVPIAQEESWECANTLSEHSAAVKAVALADDGQRFASASDDKTIKIWDLEAGNLLHELTQHTAAVNAIAITRDGQFLVSGSADKTIKLWQLETGFLLRTLTGHSGPVNAIAITPDGKTIVSGSADKTVKLWHLRTGKLKNTFKGHSHSVISLDLSPDGKLLASGSDDRSIKLWQVNNGTVKHTLTGHADSVNAIAFSPDGKTLASASRDRTIQTWQIGTGKWLATPKPHASGFYAIAYAPKTTESHAPEGKILASGGEDKTIKIWHQETGNLLQTLTGHSEAVYCLGFTRDRRTLVSGSADKTIEIWQLRS